MGKYILYGFCLFWLIFVTLELRGTLSPTDDGINGDEVEAPGEINDDELIETPIIEKGGEGKKGEDGLKESPKDSSVVGIDQMINLTKFKTEEDQFERIWGKVNEINWMFYRGIEGFIYVNGELKNVNSWWLNNDLYLDIESFESAFPLEVSDSGQIINLNTTGFGEFCSLPVNKEDVLNLMKEPNLPIENSVITQVETQLPGAIRPYRNGYHEGFDWYSGAIGREIDKNTRVFPIYEGKIVRIDHDYKEMSEEFRSELLRRSAENGGTSQVDLDWLRGKQVWIQSEGGLLVRYAHLDKTNQNLKVNDKVSFDNWIGTTGNSGTSNGVLKNDLDVHLHTDIVVCGKNFWEYGDTKDMVRSVLGIFDEANPYNNSDNVVDKVVNGENE